MGITRTPDYLPPFAGGRESSLTDQMRLKSMDVIEEKEVYDLDKIEIFHYFH